MDSSRAPTHKQVEEVLKKALEDSSLFSDIRRGSFGTFVCKTNKKIENDDLKEILTAVFTKLNLALKARRGSNDVDGMLLFEGRFFAVLTVSNYAASTRELYVSVLLSEEFAAG